MEYIEITEYLGSKLQEIKTLCTTYVRSMTDTGSRNLIHSLIEQKKVHFAELDELANDRDLSQVNFPEARVRGFLDKIGDFSAFNADMDLPEFLRFIENRLICFYEFYAFLAEFAPSGDTEYIFRRLEEEYRKEAALVRDRYELLDLSS